MHSRQLDFACHLSIRRPVRLIINVEQHPASCICPKTASFASMPAGCRTSMAWWVTEKNSMRSDNHVYICTNVHRNTNQGGSIRMLKQRGEKLLSVYLHLTSCKRITGRLETVTAFIRLPVLDLCPRMLQAERRCRAPLQQTWLFRRSPKTS